MPLLINKDQVGFISRRQAPDGTRRLINLISRIERLRIPTVLLSLDAEKAFDRIYWEFIFHTLTKFGFAGNINNAITALYSSPSARVSVNGTLSSSFTISNGTRQGCPLSPLIFDLVMEPMAEAIRAHQGIKGIDVKGVQHKLNLFADDVILTLTDVDRSLPNVTALLELYGTLTYYKVNASKSLILGFQISPRVKLSLQARFPYSWQEKSLPYLGILLPKKISKLMEINLPPLFTSLQSDIARL